MQTPVRSSTIAAAAHRRTAGRYWRLADIAEREGHIAGAREFVAIAMMLDRRAAETADGTGRSGRTERSQIKPLSDELPPFGRATVLGGAASGAAD